MRIATNGDHFVAPLYLKRMEIDLFVEIITGKVQVISRFIGKSKET